MGVTFWLACAVCMITLAMSIEIAIGVRKIKHLQSIPAILSDSLPRVSIIVSALNEKDTIEPALCSVLALDYPQLEVIAINDRSTDGTGAILERMCVAHARLRVVHIHELPSGWLGKNHALHCGAGMATGEYLLFTDADVVFESSAIRRAVAYCEQQRIDHLAVLVEVLAKGRPLLSMLVLNFILGFFSRYKPWKTRTSRNHFVGVGAFNMVRSAAYRTAGGHEAIALAILDDMMLGKIIKRHGFSQDVLYGTGMVSVAWYRNTIEMFKGLQKNAFAAFDYRISGVILLTMAIAVLQVWPWIGLVMSDAPECWLHGVTVLTMAALYIDLWRVGARHWGRWCMLFMPVISIVSLVMCWRACLLTLLQGGVNWRGTHYKLADLMRAQR